MLSSEINGTRHFGTIKDLKANMRAVPFFSKMIERDDPSAMFLLSQSAPLLVPERVNASMTIEALDA